MPWSLRGKPDKQFKARIQAEIRRRVPRLDASSAYRVHMVFHAKWRTQAGRILKRDAHNYMTPLADLICEAGGIDDSQFFEMTCSKTHTTGEEFVFVTLTRC
jgi:Holliday junction resolvase RusA-like endonuclease